MEFCVYLTIYSGNKLPPFYIGSTSVKRIKQGYKGSVRSKEYAMIWKSEPKEYFKTIILQKYKDRDSASKREAYIQEKLDVVNNSLYVNMAIIKNGKVYYSWTEEKRKNVGDRFRGKKLTEDHKRKIRLSNVGRKHTPETKLKISVANKGKKSHFSEWNKTREFSKETLERVSLQRSKKYTGSGNPRYGKRWSDAEKQNNSDSQNPMKLYQFDMEWNLIRIWKSVFACSVELNYNRNSLRTIASKNKKYKGFYWSFDGKYKDDKQYT